VLRLRLATAGKPVVLCIGAHCDDIEIGCGGTLLQLRASYPDVTIHWAILSAPPAREPEARASARCFLGDGAQHSVSTEQFRDGFFPFDGAAIKSYFEALAQRVKPDLIITHDRNDLHQDHRLVGELTLQTYTFTERLKYGVPGSEQEMRDLQIVTYERNLSLQRPDLTAAAAAAAAAATTTTTTPGGKG